MTWSVKVDPESRQSGFPAARLDAGCQGSRSERSRRPDLQAVGPRRTVCHVVVGNLLSTAIGGSRCIQTQKTSRGLVRRAFLRLLARRRATQRDVAAPLTGQPEVIGRRRCWAPAPSSMFAAELPSPTTA
jgi:hypothetical protein